MEEQVKQLSEQVRAMEAEKISNRDHVSRQQEQINQLQKELLSLRGNMGNQGLPERLPATGSS
jgi:peptidoglycan hydrolase CwlO-like protein